MTRRKFIGGAAALSAAASLPAFASKPDEIRAALLHVGTNMWQKGVHAEAIDFDPAVWHKLVDRMVARKYNMVLVDVGESMLFPSHPEIAVKGAMPPERFLNEVRRLRSLGLEPIPKLNFSTTHGAWMGQYLRMISTKPYYQFVTDVIRDCWEAFDRPRIFHIGYDEEWVDDGKEPPVWRGMQFVVVRQGELWWHDFNYTVKCIEDLGMRAWSFGDYNRQHPDFAKRCPKSVLVSNWYYAEHFDIKMKGLNAMNTAALRTYHDLEAAGLDQVPCCSNCDNKLNPGLTVRNCRKWIAPERLKGFAATPWEYCVPYGEPRCLECIDLMADALDERG